MLPLLALALSLGAVSDQQIQHSGGGFAVLSGDVTITDMSKPVTVTLTTDQSSHVACGFIIFMDQYSFTTMTPARNLKTGERSWRLEWDSVPQGGQRDTYYLRIDILKSDGTLVSSSTHLFPGIPFISTGSGVVPKKHLNPNPGKGPGANADETISIDKDKKTFGRVVTVTGKSKTGIHVGYLLPVAEIVGQANEITYRVTDYQPIVPIPSEVGPNSPTEGTRDWQLVFSIRRKKEQTPGTYAVIVRTAAKVEEKPTRIHSWEWDTVKVK